MESDHRSGGKHLVICPGSLGDTVLRLVAVRVLQERGELSKTLLLVGTFPYLRLARVLVPGSLLSDFDGPPWWELFSGGAGCSERLALELSGVRKALLWLPQDEHADETLRRAGVKVRIWRSIPREGVDGGHVLEHLSGVSRKELEPFPETILPRRDPQAEGARFRAVIHPGAGSPAKRIPIVCYRRLAGALRREGWEVIWLVGPAEAEEPGDFSPCDWRIPVVDSPSLEELTDLLRGASVAIGNDSGVLHLAAVLGIPVIAVFLRTDPEFWHPLGPATFVLDARNPAEPQVRSFRFLTPTEIEPSGVLQFVLLELLKTLAVNFPPRTQRS